MLVTWILFLSVFSQCLAIFLSLRLIFVSEQKKAWTFFAIAISLMAFRRSITIYRFIRGDISHPPDLAAELVALIISLLMVISLIGIIPLSQKTKTAKKSNLDSKLPTTITTMFILMCLLVWLNEILDLPHILMKAPRTPINWQESLVETVLIVILGLFVYSKTVHFVSQTSETEKILREKEERYHSTLDNMLEGCQIISTDWRYLYINDAGAANGRQPKEELLGRTMMECYPGIENTEMFAALRRCMEDRVPCRMENEFVYADGSKAWFELSIQAVPEGIFILSLDITERKQAEEALKNTAMRLNEAQRIANIGSWELDLTTNVLTWSDDIYRMFEIDPEKFGASYEAFLDTIHPDDREAVNLAYTNSLKTRTPYAIDHRLRFPDGRIKFVHEQCETFYENDRPIRSVGIVQDITERKRAKEALQATEERFRLMVNSVKDYAIVMLDPKGHVITWNEGAQRVKGYKPDEIIGKHFSIFYPRDDIKADKPERELTAAADQGYFEDEGWRVRKNGSRFWANVTITALRDKEDHLRGFAKITRDMTERKISEENIRRLNTELRMKNEELEQVLYATSHDLRSPLVNVQGFNKELDASINKLLSVLSDMKIPPGVRKQIMPILTEDIPESIRFILASTSKMDTLLTGLLQLSRVGRQKLTLTRLDMNALVSDIFSTLKSQIKESKVRLEVSDLPPCKGDPIQINQVFTNLIENAIKYLNAAREGRITISGEKQGKRAIYCVEDNGIGIAKNHIDKIFEMFHQLDPSKNGTGLGLTIMKRILDKHRGSIHVESEPEKGSRFYVELPV